MRKENVHILVGFGRKISRFSFPFLSLLFPSLPLPFLFSLFYPPVFLFPSFLLPILSLLLFLISSSPFLFFLLTLNSFLLLLLPSLILSSLFHYLSLLHLYYLPPFSSTLHWNTLASLFPSLPVSAAKNFECVFSFSLVNMSYRAGK